MDKLKLMSFSNIIESLKKAYDEIVLNKNKKFKWNGPLLKSSSRILVTSPNIDVTLGRESLQYNKKEQGRSEIETILGCAVQLGIQQGTDLSYNNNLLYLESIINRVESIEILLDAKLKKGANKNEMIKKQLDSIKEYVQMCKEPFKDDEKEK